MSASWVSSDGRRSALSLKEMSLAGVSILVSSSLGSELSLSASASGVLEDIPFSELDWRPTVGCGEGDLSIVSGLAKMGKVVESPG